MLSESLLCSYSSSSVRNTLYKRQQHLPETSHLNIILLSIVIPLRCSTFEILLRRPVPPWVDEDLLTKCFEPRHQTQPQAPLYRRGLRQKCSSRWALERQSAMASYHGFGTKPRRESSTFRCVRKEGNPDPSMPPISISIDAFLRTIFIAAFVHSLIRSLI